jgi:UDP-N-acetylglucosamine 2-epimerase (non-hydrolysing)
MSTHQDHTITYTVPSFYDDLADHAERHVHLIMIATKPDIIKQIPLYHELKRRGQLVILGHTGQHYDENLSGGMLKEFGVEPDFNLNVRGSMHEVVSQIIGRLGYIIGQLKERGKIVIPYVHGDTTFCHQFSSVHVEAGLRTLTPDFRDSQFAIRNPNDESRMTNRVIPLLFAIRNSNPFDCRGWHQFLMDRNNWKRGSLEPYPEQFNTRCAECATGIHLAPVELDREFMLSEGFPEDRIFVTGNSVADATHDALKRVDQSKVFERHPELADGDFVRFCIHRRENCISEKRFRAIYGAMKMLIEEGRKVLLINMIQTKKAFERFGLESEVENLAKDHSNFILSDVWPEYRDVIAAMSRAAVCATDSGSMQEEMNVLGVPCVTLRFGSDRSESIMNGGNLIAPPVDSSAIANIITYAWGNEEMKKAPKIYGEGVSKKSIDVVLEVLKKSEVFRSEEQRLEE